MPVVCLKYKRKPWVVKYREPWSGRPRQRAFAAEAEARAFEDAQASLYERERAIIKAVRRRRTQGRPASLTIAEVLDRYLDSLGNPSTRAASAYHLRLSDFGGRGRVSRAATTARREQKHSLPPHGHRPGRLSLGGPLGLAAHQSTGGPATGQPRAANAGPAHGP